MIAAQHCILNDAMRKNYEAALKSHDFRRHRAYETQAICCDAYHLKYQPEQIRCCVLGQRYGFFI